MSTIVIYALVVFGIVASLSIYRDMVVKMAEHKAKMFVGPDPVMPNELLLLIPGSYEDGVGGIVVPIDGEEFQFNAGIVRYHRISRIHNVDTWRKIKLSKVLSFAAQSMTNTQQTPSSVPTTPVVQPTNVPQQQMTNKQAAAYIKQNTLFTDAEKDGWILPGKFQWKFVGPDEWAVEAK